MSGEARVVSGRWWRSEFASLGMAKPTPSWVLRHGDLKCALWGGWWPAPARERRAVAVLGWDLGDLGDVGGCVGLVWGLVGVAPLVDEVVVGDGDEQREQDGLGDAAVGEPVLRVAEIKIVSLDSAVEALGVGPDGLVGSDPGRTEVCHVLAELVEVAEVVLADGDGVLVADPRQFAGLVVGLWGKNARFGRGVGGSLPGVGEVDRGGPAGFALVEAVETGGGPAMGRCLLPGTGCGRCRRCSGSA